jgi:osmotically-inducible protein OsmY
MTNKQLYNLVFENYVQAKRELLREGYTKTHLEEVDFNEIFDQTKKKMLEEKVKKLQRENEMLKGKLAKTKHLKEFDVTGGGLGSKYQGNAPGSDSLWKGLSTVFASLGVKEAIADTLINKLKASDKKNYGNIKSILKDDNDISKFKIKVKRFLDSGMKLTTSIKMALDELKNQTPLAESRRRRY